MLGIQCTKHQDYNGANSPADNCDSCWHIFSYKRLADNFPDLRVIQPIKLVNEPALGLATTGQLIREIYARCTDNGTINYKTVGKELNFF